MPLATRNRLSVHKKWRERDQALAFDIVMGAITRRKGGKLRLVREYCSMVVSYDMRLNRRDSC